MPLPLEDSKSQSPSTHVATIKVFLTFFEGQSPIRPDPETPTIHRVLLLSHRPLPESGIMAKCSILEER